MLICSDEEFDKLLHRMAVFETKIRHLEVNVKVNGGYGNYTTFTMTCREQGPVSPKEIHTQNKRYISLWNTFKKQICSTQLPERLLQPPGSAKITLKKIHRNETNISKKPQSKSSDNL